MSAHLVLLALFCWLLPNIAMADGAAVSVHGRDILLGGKPFIVQGAAGSTRLDVLRQLGANTIRTYGAEEADVLDEAHRHGLKVILGFWLEHPRRGVSYRDPAFVRSQLAKLEAFVERHKRHPALLMWGLGNEVESELADDAEVWPGIEAAAKMVKRLDPAHPTLAVLAEAGNNKVAKLVAAAPSIDVLGVNSYGEGLISLPERVRKQGWDGPLLITELGPRGQWQAAKTPWGAFIEPSSTEKAALLATYLPKLAPPASNGWLAFLWGNKQEVTPTWHSMLLPSGEWNQTAEILAAQWRGRTPGGNHAPRISNFQFSHAPQWPAGHAGRALLEANDPDGDALRAEWLVMAESTDLRVAGDLEIVPPNFPRATLGGDVSGVSIQGLKPGRYRLFLVLRDGKGAAATANLPFLVE